MLCFGLDSGTSPGVHLTSREPLPGVPDRPFGRPQSGPQQEPSIQRAKGPRDDRTGNTRKRPRSYAGRTRRRLDEATTSGVEPGKPGNEERTQMARATTAPVPVTTKRHVWTHG